MEELSGMRVASWWRYVGVVEDLVMGWGLFSVAEVIEKGGLHEGGVFR